MEVERLKGAVRGIRAPEAVKARIRQAALRETAPARRRGRKLRRAAVLLAAVLFLLALSAVAVAAFRGDWFSAFFFGPGKAEPSPAQSRFLEESSVGVGESVTAEGYTVTVETALYDAQELYLVLRVEGPAGVRLDFPVGEGSLFFKDMHGESTGTYERTGRLTCSTKSLRRLEDGDGRENTATLLLLWQRSFSADSNHVFTDGELWSFRFAGLSTRTGPCFEVVTPLCEAEWRFTFPLTEQSEERELLSAPVICTVPSGGEGKPKEPAEVELTSFIVRPFGAVCEYRYLPGNRPPSVDIPEATLVMKDGSTVALEPHFGGGAIGAPGGTMAYLCPTPVLPDEIAYLLLPEGVVIEAGGT